MADYIVTTQYWGGSYWGGLYWGLLTGVPVDIQYTEVMAFAVAMICGLSFTLDMPTSASFTLEMPQTVSLTLYKELSQ